MARVLVACEFSGTVRDAFRARGIDAWSCDLLPTEADPTWHIQGDVKTNGPAPERWQSMREAAEFFRTFLALPCRVAVENPIMLGHARAIVGAGPTQIIQPWQFGHGETKATCLWLRNLPPLMPTNIVDGREQRVFKMPPSADRWKERSRTFQGIADAMADQWSAVLSERLAA